MPGSSPFEGKLVKLINDEYFKVRQRPGFAYRLKQSRWNTQFIDVLVDSSSKSLYLAIECKSIDPKKTKKFYFSAWTLGRKGKHQVETISEFVEKTQRFGIMAAEIRRGSGPIPNDIFLIPWSHVVYAFETGEKSIDPAKLPDKYPRLIKNHSGVLNLDECLQKLRKL